MRSSLPASGFSGTYWTRGGGACNPICGSWGTAGCIIGCRIKGRFHWPIGPPLPPKGPHPWLFPKPIEGTNPPKLCMAVQRLQYLQQKAQKHKHISNGMQMAKMEPMPTPLDGTCNSNTCTPEDCSITPAFTVILSGSGFFATSGVV